MRKKKPKQYEIDSFEKLVNVVSKENFEGLTTDLIMWLGYVVQFTESYRKNNPTDANKTNWEIAKLTFIWIDDNKRELNLIRIHNQSTGEITEFELNSKPKKK